MSSHPSTSVTRTGASWPGVALDPAIRATDDLGDAVQADLLLLVTPAQNLTAIVEELIQSAERLPPGVVCAKGIERRTGALMSDAVRRVAPGLRLAVLSGPTFAQEVATGLPAAVSLACDDARLGAAVVDALGGPAFRPYLTDDLTGVQIGGAVKNVIAIAAGIATGRGLGDNARAAIVARGFAELTRLAAAKGARQETLAGLSGLGDLVLTCTSDRSRNYTFGCALGRGESPATVLDAREAVTEGVTSAPAIMAMAATLGVEMPIVGAVHAVLHRGASVDDAIGGLLARPFRPEAGASRGGRS